MNAALVAGLAQALVINSNPNQPREAWAAIYATMRRTDPYSYAEVPWTYRSVDRWLDLAQRLARDADHQPAKLFALLNAVFADTIKWEAEVPFVVMFVAVELAEHDPLAALQLSMEWGEDTDSYAQLLGAFIGALYGPAIFPPAMRETVMQRLALDYDEELGEWMRLLRSS